MQFFKDKNLVVIFVIVALILIVVGTWAVNAFQESVRSGQIVDYTNRAEEAIDKGNYPEAFLLLQKGGQLDPTNPYFKIREADVAFLNGDYELSLSLYSQANSENQVARSFYQALEQVADEKIDDGLTTLTNVKKALSETDPLTMERVDHLIETLPPIKDIANTPLKQATIVKTLIEENAYVLSHKVITKLLRDNPGYRDAFYLQGITYLKQGQLENAKSSLQKAIEIDPNYEPARQLLSELE